MAHIPVMVEEIVKFLDPQPGKNYIDCTLGDGGHSAAILERTAPDGRVLGFDLDPEAVKVARENLKKFGGRLMAVNRGYTELAATAAELRFRPVAGIIMDLGFSSPQLEERNRGFSFLRDEPLDMRYSVGQELTAAEIVNSWSKDDLIKILREYGEERFADRVAEAVVAARKKQRIISTAQLVEVVKSAVPRNYEKGRISPATRTFQALRIAVNDELDSIRRVLPQALDALEPGGVIVAIAFHSLEDRIVKDFMKQSAKERKLEIVTKKIVLAGEAEVAANPRSRSAKLRAARKK